MSLMPKNIIARKYFTGTYSLRSNEYGRKVGKHPDMPLAWRLFEVCAATANVYGHAHFDSVGELCAALGRKGKPAVRQRVKEALGRLIKWEFVAPGSTPLCIAMPVSFVRNPTGGKKLCHAPHHADRRDRCWVNPAYGWEKEPGEWLGELGQEGAALTEWHPHDTSEGPRRRRPEPKLVIPDEIPADWTGEVATPDIRIPVQPEVSVDTSPLPAVIRSQPEPTKYCPDCGCYTPVAEDGTCGWADRHRDEPKRSFAEKYGLKRADEPPVEAEMISAGGW